jgi:hypothetical protein
MGPGPHQVRTKRPPVEQGGNPLNRRYIGVRWGYQSSLQVARATNKYHLNLVVVWPVPCHTATMRVEDSHVYA